MSHAVSWFQIQSAHGHELQTFYKNVFGWSYKPLPGGGDMVMVAGGKDGIAGGIGTSQNKLPSVAVYISVGNIASQIGKIERAGGHLAMPEMELPGGMGSIAGFTDPSGNWIGLWAKPAPKPKPKAKAKKKAAAVKKKAAAPKKKAAKPKKKAAKKR